MEPGDRIGRYVVEVLLGAGGMGEVYRAYDEVLRRRVALKLLRADASGSRDTSSGIARVLREARMAASLQHPNVVAIHDVGEHEGTSFLVMELITGRSLRALVGAEVPAAERLRWLADAARALAAAHRAGLVHRDVKPENVLLREDGVVKVLDFGIARQAGPAPAHAAAGPASTRSPAAITLGAREGESSIAGTPAYMAPEQIRGEPLDARVDQFAWGVMAYEMLAGRLPWSSDPASLLSAVLTQAAPPLDPSALGVAPAVTLSISRAMRQDRDERFASMDELLASMGLASQDPAAAAIHRSIAAGSAPELASAPTELATRSAASLALPSPPAATGRSGRGRAPAVAVGGAALALVAWLAVRATHHETAPVAAPGPSASSSATAALSFHPTEVHRLTFDTGCEEFPSLTPDGSTVVFDATSGDDTHLVALDIATGARRTLTHDPGWQYAASVSPDGARVAYYATNRDDRGTYVVPIDGSAPPRRVRAGGSRPTWAPDGRALWVSGETGAVRVELEGGRVTRELASPSGGDLLRVNELADGRVLGFVLSDNRLTSMGLFDYPPSGAPAPFVAGPLDEAFAITRDGAHVLFSRVLPTDQVELWQAPLAGGAPSATGDNSVQPTKGLAIAGDRIVWSTCRTQTVLALLRSSSVATRELRPEPLFPPSEWEDVGSVGMPSDPAKLVLLSNRSGRRQPWVVDVKGAQPARMLSTGSLEPANPAVSADGRWLAFEAIGSGIWIVPMDGSAAPRALTRRTGDRSPTFARDATAVYFETSGPSGRRAIAALPLDAVEGAAPEVILDGALRPAASPVDGRLAYVEQAGAEETGSPRVLDTLTGKSRPLSSALGAGEHPGVAWSPDGSRIAVADGPQQIVEFDSAHGNVLRRYAGADAIDGLTYLGRDVVVVRGVWGGDLWIARDAPAGPADSATGAR